MFTNKIYIAALMCLKRKKTYEVQVEKLMGARMTIEQQVMTLEGANVSLEAMNAMKMGAASMKTIHNDMYAFSCFCTSSHQIRMLFSSGSLLFLN